MTIAATTSSTPLSATYSTATSASAVSASTVASAAFSAEAAVVATLGGSGNQVQLYDPTGLLTQVEQAGEAAAGASPAGATSAGTGAAVDANWAAVLKSRPELGGQAITDAFDQGIVSSLSVYA